MNVLTDALLDQLAEVGVKNWALYTAVVLLVAFATWGSGILPMWNAILIILALNLGGALVVTIYWTYKQPHHELKTMRELVKRQEGRK